MTRGHALVLRGTHRFSRFDVRAADVERVGEWSPGLRGTGFILERGKGLPGVWTILSARAVVEHLAGSASPAHIGFGGVVFQVRQPLDTLA
jgi:hypothetical protein